MHCVKICLKHGTNISCLLLSVFFSSYSNADVWQQLSSDSQPKLATNETLNKKTEIKFSQEFDGSNEVTILVAGENSMDARVKKAFLGDDNDKWRLIITKTWHEPGLHFTAKLQKHNGNTYEYITTFHQYAQLNQKGSSFVCSHSTSTDIEPAKCQRA